MNYSTLIDQSDYSISTILYNNTNNNIIIIVDHLEETLHISVNDTM